MLHNSNGPAIEWYDGSRTWHQYDKLHRISGPAMEWNNGTKKWYYDGVLHREHGPAIEWNDGETEFYFHGIRYSDLDYQKIMYYYKLYRNIIQEIKFL